ncbi:NAD-dependent epimerase/dehydratase family protein [Paenibacillus sp. OV219]|uniref:NAD-dependent epimerase/dehydratase family protein n=1 Tax=Paenibacillus sp. OV219 TaxID=1884377 RepID=UPI0008C4D59D|nr:NAD-dependent epimerase/dehydratase family protein [Paenibacillus sp. OV219]SEM64016.1 Semialdehyde dehydrogenase, NAD binding domain [Paenibacillus sp. OV219]
MKVLLFGATGMVGQSVLRECLLDSEVERVLAVGRSRTGKQDPKLSEIVHTNLLDLSAIESQLSGYDACLFCLGVSSAGMSEEKYRSITYDLTLSVAHMLVRLNPGMTFIYVTGSGTDSTEQGRSMWARVKGKTENDLLKLPFKAAYMFRPGAIIPKYGVRSRTGWYMFIYAFIRPFAPLLERAFKNSVTTSDQLGRAMVKVAKQGYSKPHIESSDINHI